MLLALQIEKHKKERSKEPVRCWTYQLSTMGGEMGSGSLSSCSQTSSSMTWHGTVIDATSATLGEQSGKGHKVLHQYLYQHWGCAVANKTTHCTRSRIVIAVAAAAIGEVAAATAAAIVVAEVEIVWNSLSCGSS